MIVPLSSISFEKPNGFIVLEGPNGSGKSSLSSFLCDSLKKLNHTPCPTFEPGATSIGKTIRQIVLGQSSKEKTLTPLAELLLFSADRNIHVEQVINPALSKKQIVICDRFFYSTLAFQGYGRGYPLKQIESLTELAVGSLRPDVVLLLDLEPELGLARTKGRAVSDIASSDSFEAEELSFHKRLRDGFLSIAKDSPEPFVVLDASKSMKEVHEQAWSVINKLIMSLQ